MTNTQEKQIASMRRMGKSYGQIAELLKLSKNTVKSYCQRNNLGVSARERSECPFCGKPVPQVEHRKPRRFCSEGCRKKWWREHQHLIDRRSTITLSCLNCGKEFTDYPGTGRKYCSHECYVAHRFGGDRA